MTSILKKIFGKPIEEHDKHTPVAPPKPTPIKPTTAKSTPTPKPKQDIIDKDYKDYPPKPKPKKADHTALRVALAVIFACAPLLSGATTGDFIRASVNAFITYNLVYFITGWFLD